MAWQNMVFYGGDIFCMFKLIRGLVAFCLPYPSLTFSNLKNKRTNLWQNIQVDFTNPRRVPWVNHLSNRDFVKALSETAAPPTTEGTERAGVEPHCVLQTLWKKYL